MFPSFGKKAHAGVFAFLSTVLSGKEEVDNSTNNHNNSQKLAILEAPLSAKPATGGGDITIVDQSALEYESDSLADGYKSDQISSYIVRQGDTLSQIAEMFHVSVNTIIWANDIKNGVINPGDTLVILPISGIKYEVKSGDTIQTIVKKYKSDLDEVLLYNGLTKDDKLAVGDEIVIPHAEITTTTKVAAPSGSTKAVDTKGYFIAPLAGYRKTQGVHGYNGVDLAASIGTKLVASAGGTVIVSKSNGAYNGGYGNYVVISHPNGTQTLYGHMNSVSVSVGQKVDQGQPIGTLGNTGKSTGPHVHFEVRGAKNPF